MRNDAQPDTWACHARPASTGNTCGHVNRRGATTHHGLEVCAGCGCTKKASDDRAAKEAAKRAPAGARSTR